MGDAESNADTTNGNRVDDTDLYNEWRAQEESLQTQRDAEDQERIKKRKREDDEIEKERKRKDDEVEKGRREGERKAKAVMLEKHKADMTALETRWKPKPRVPRPQDGFTGVWCKPGMRAQVHQGFAS